MEFRTTRTKKRSEERRMPLNRGSSNKHKDNNKTNRNDYCKEYGIHSTEFIVSREQ